MQFLNETLSLKHILFSIFYNVCVVLFKKEVFYINDQNITFPRSMHDKKNDIGDFCKYNIFCEITSTSYEQSTI